MDSEMADKIWEKQQSINAQINHDQVLILTNLEQITELKRKIRELVESNRVLAQQITHNEGQVEGLNKVRWLK